MRRLFSIYTLIFLSVSFCSMAQMGGMGGAMGKMNAGHFYGKVVDSATGAGIPFASVQLTGPKWDSVSQTMKTVIYAGQLTDDNGQFSLEKLPVMGPMFTPLQYTLQITAMGYSVYTKTLSFDISKMAQKMKKAKAAQANADMSNPTAGLEGVIDIVDKDLGNIKLSVTAQALKTVTVSGDVPAMEVKPDKRVFDVSKSLTTSGGTAEDVLKNIPSVNVDVDGNVTLRNGSPQIYVDGVPSTLTIDQIPADEIDKVEVITNPSAKYDASAGSGGIINIIMKHNKAPGYNGSVRGGIDEYGKLTAGLDFNLHQGKMNYFVNFFYKQIEHKMYGTESKDAYSDIPSLASPNPLNIMQNDTNNMSGYFAFARGGFDYFIDNRNTLTVSGTYGTGHFNIDDLLFTKTDSLAPVGSQPNSTTWENSLSNRVFNNVGGSVLFKHLYPKDEENFTASMTANVGSSTGTGTYLINNYSPSAGEISSLDETQTSGGTSGYYVGKFDYTDPITTKSKIDAGAMGTINNVYSDNDVSLGNFEIGNESNKTLYNSQVYAAYFSYTHTFNSKFDLQAAARAEQSFYSGIVYSSDTLKLNPQKLFYVFPSASATYHINDNSDLQLSYTTHITRPNFSQLVINNYSNSENVQIGNPNLKPAYMHSFELSYIKNFDKKNNLLISAYYKITYDLITSQLDSSFHNTLLQQIQYFSTYENANYGYSEGLELTSQNSIGTWLDIMGNINLFESGINATNLGIKDTLKPYLSYFAKLNFTFKLPKSFNIQIMGNYLSKAEISPAGGGGGGGGRWGGGMGGGITPSANGYINPNYWVDVAVKKDFFKSKLSATLSVKDIFATAVSSTYLLATNPGGIPLYYQNTSRRRDPQFFSLTVSYKFGQTDFSLFKRKNNSIDTGPDMGGGDSN